MSIWGHRDSEPSAEEAHESQSPAQVPGEPGAGAQAGPQGQAEPGAEAGPGPHAEEPAPAHGDMPDGPPAPVGSQAATARDDMVVLDRATAAGDQDQTGIIAQRWSEILTAFVDDPRGSVKTAADAVEEAIDEFVSSVRARQRALESSWHGAEADTEQLRTALRDYRRFWHEVQQLDPAGKAGAAAGG